MIIRSDRSNNSCEGTEVGSSAVDLSKEGKAKKVTGNDKSGLPRYFRAATIVRARHQVEYQSLGDTGGIHGAFASSQICIEMKFIFQCSHRRKYCVFKRLE